MAKGRKKILILRSSSVDDGRVRCEQYCATERTSSVLLLYLGEIFPYAQTRERSNTPFVERARSLPRLSTCRRIQTDPEGGVIANRSKTAVSNQGNVWLIIQIYSIDCPLLRRLLLQSPFLREKQSPLTKTRGHVPPAFLPQLEH